MASWTHTSSAKTRESLLLAIILVLRNVHCSVDRAWGGNLYKYMDSLHGAEYVL